MEQKVRCNKAKDPKCPLPDCWHGKPHVSDDCSIWDDCDLGDRSIRVRCVKIKPRKKT